MRELTYPRTNSVFGLFTGIFVKKHVSIFHRYRAHTNTYFSFSQPCVFPGQIECVYKSCLNIYAAYENLCV